MIDLILIMLILTNFKVLGSSRVRDCIWAVSLQGVLLGLLPLLFYSETAEPDLLLMGALSISLKGVMFPWLLSRAVRVATIKQPVEPYVGYNLSVAFGVLSIALGLVLGQPSRLPVVPPSPLLVPVALSTMWVGLFITVARHKALTQALGYLIFENGIHAFGAAVLRHSPLVVELGILLDIFFAVFVMGITMFHISRTFDTIDTAWLVELKE